MTVRGEFVDVRVVGIESFWTRMLVDRDIGEPFRQRNHVPVAIHHLVIEQVPLNRRLGDRQPHDRRLRTAIRHDALANHDQLLGWGQLFHAHGSSRNLAERHHPVVDVAGRLCLAERPARHPEHHAIARAGAIGGQAIVGNRREIGGRRAFPVVDVERTNLLVERVGHTSALAHDEPVAVRNLVIQQVPLDRPVRNRHLHQPGLRATIRDDPLTGHIGVGERNGLGHRPHASWNFQERHVRVPVEPGQLRGAVRTALVDRELHVVDLVALLQHLVELVLVHRIQERVPIRAFPVFDLDRANQIANGLRRFLGGGSALGHHEPVAVHDLLVDQVPLDASARDGHLHVAGLGSPVGHDSLAHHVGAGERRGLRHGPHAGRHFGEGNVRIPELSRFLRVPVRAALVDRELNPISLCAVLLHLVELVFIHRVEECVAVRALAVLDLEGAHQLTNRLGGFFRPLFGGHLGRLFGHRLSRRVFRQHVEPVALHVLPGHGQVPRVALVQWQFVRIGWLSILDRAIPQERAVHVVGQRLGQGMVATSRTTEHHRARNRIPGIGLDVECLGIVIGEHERHAVHGLVTIRHRIGVVSLFVVPGGAGELVNQQVGRFGRFHHQPRAEHDLVVLQVPAERAAAHIEPLVAGFRPTMLHDAVAPGHTIAGWPVDRCLTRGQLGERHVRVTKLSGFLGLRLAIAGLYRELGSRNTLAILEQVLQVRLRGIEPRATGPQVDFDRTQQLVLRLFGDLRLLGLDHVRLFGELGLLAPIILVATVGFLGRLQSLQFVRLPRGRHLPGDGSKQHEGEHQQDERVTGLAAPPPGFRAKRVQSKHGQPPERNGESARNP